MTEKANRYEFSGDGIAGRLEPSMTGVPIIELRFGDSQAYEVDVAEASDERTVSGLVAGRGRTTVRVHLPDVYVEAGSPQAFEGAAIVSVNIIDVEPPPTGAALSYRLVVVSGTASFIQT